MKSIFEEEQPIENPSEEQPEESQEPVIDADKTVEEPNSEEGEVSEEYQNGFTDGYNQALLDMENELGDDKDLGNESEPNEDLAEIDFTEN